MEFNSPSPRLSIFFLLLFIAATSALLLTFRDLPPDSTWKGWRVVSVESAVTESAITEAFRQNGISEYATESNSLIAVSPGEPVPIKYIDAVNERRRAWFELEGSRLVYVKDHSDIDRKIAAALEPLGSRWAMEAGRAYFAPFLLIPFALWILAFSGAKNRLIFLAALPSILILPITLNRWQGFIASIILILATDYCALYLPSTGFSESKRKILARLIRSRPLLASIALLLVPLFAGSFGSAMRVLAAIALGVASFKAMREAELALLKRFEAGRAHPFFTPVRIVPFKVRPKNKRIFLASALAVLAFTGGIAARSHTQLTEKKNGGELPCPVPAGYTGHNGFGSDAYFAFMERRVDNELPDLGDFLAVRWNVETAAWRRIQTPEKTPLKGSVAGYTDYSIGNDGRISGTPKIMLEFDTGFIRRSIAENATPLDRMLADQGRFVSVSLTRLIQ